MSSLVDYLNRPSGAEVEEIDTPVTGYGNEALWEMQDAPAGPAAPVTERPHSTAAPKAR